jgi:hypothetical protein
MDALYEDIHVLLCEEVTGWKIFTQGILQPLAEAEFWQTCQNWFTVHMFRNLFKHC